MNASMSLILSVFLGIVCTVTALKEGDCEGENLSDICLIYKIYTPLFMTFFI